MTDGNQSGASDYASYGGSIVDKLNSTNMKMGSSFASDFVQGLRSKADSGDFASQRDLANRYAQGEGVQKDLGGTAHFTAHLVANLPNRCT